MLRVICFCCCLTFKKHLAVGSGRIASIQLLWKPIYRGSFIQTMLWLTWEYWKFYERKALKATGRRGNQICRKLALQNDLWNVKELSWSQICAAPSVACTGIIMAERQMPSFSNKKKIIWIYYRLTALWQTFTYERERVRGRLREREGESETDRKRQAEGSLWPSSKLAL